MKRLSISPKRRDRLHARLNFVVLWMMSLSVAFILNFGQASSGQQTPDERQYVFEVSVLEADTNKPLAGVSIHVKQLGREAVLGFKNYKGARDSGYSQTDGRQYFRFKDYGQYAIVVEHDDFVSQEKWVPTVSTEQNNRVIFMLKKKRSTKEPKLVNVLLIGEDDNQPVIGARVFLQESFAVIYKGDTDSYGKTQLTITEGKTFKVEIYHSQFKTYISTLRLNNDQQDYFLVHRMKRKTSTGEQKEVVEELKLVVGVYSKDASGNSTVPVPGARLSFPDSQVKYTDPNGRVEVIHKFAPDQEINIDVDATGFIPRSVNHRITYIKPDLQDTLTDALSITVETPSKLNTAAWVGGWSGDSGRTFHSLSGRDNLLSGSYNYDLPGAFHANARGNGQLSNCVVTKSDKHCLSCDVEVAKCIWSGTHQDDTKPAPISSTGVAYLKREGDKLEVSFHALEQGSERFTGTIHRLTKLKDTTRSEATRQLEEYNRQVREGKISRPVAKLKGGEPVSTISVCDSFQEEESGWKSVWTRRGSSDVFDAAFTGPAGQKASTVNTVTVKGNSVQISRTSSTDGNLCTYVGTIQADGKSVEGTYTCSMGGARGWRATGLICGTKN